MGLFDRFNRSNPIVEQRAPKAALQNLTYRSPGSPMIMEWGAEEAFRYGYLSNIIVYRCVQLIADTISALPFRAGASITKPMSFNEGAPLARLLGPPPLGPNPETAADELWANAIAQYLVAGRFGWEIEYSGRTPVALWPMAAQRLTAIPTSDGTRKSAYFQGFKYGPPGDETNLSVDEVFYCWRPSLHDFRQPESALQAARLDISVAVMQDRYDHAFLKNDARPAAIMIVQRFAEKEEYRAFKEQINAEYGGPDNAGKTMLLEQEGNENGAVTGSVEFKQLGISQKDAEFIKRHEQKFRNIAMALGVPWSKLDASGRTFDNADAEDATWEESCILPLVRRLQNRVNVSLAPKLGREMGWFDISSLKASQPVRKFTQVNLVDALAAEIVTMTEARSEVGLQPFTPQQLKELEEAKPEIPPQLVLAQSGSGPLTPDENSGSEDEDSSADRSKRHIPEVDHAERKRKVLARVEAQAKALERQWERSFKALFAKQEREAIKRLEGKRGRQMLSNESRSPGDQIFDPEYWRSATADDTTRLFESVFTSGGGRIADYFGFSFDIEAPYAQEFIMQQTNRLAGQVTDTTYGAIKEQMSQGVAAGEDIPALSKRIRSVFEEASKTRATMIARTEVLGGFNQSAILVAKELPADVVGGKEWIGSGYDNDRCTELGQSPPIGIGDGWDGIESPPLHPNCRCTIGLLSPEQMNEMSGPRSKKYLPITDITQQLARMAAKSFDNGNRLKVVS